MTLKQKKLKINSRTRKRGLKNKKTSKNKFIKSKKNQKKNNNKLNIKIGGGDGEVPQGYNHPPTYVNNEGEFGFGNNGNNEGEFGFGNNGNNEGEFGFGNNGNVATEQPPLYYKGINIFDNTKTLSIFNQYNSFTTKTNNIAIHNLFTSIFNNENIKKKNNDTKESGEIIFSFFAELLVYLENKNKLTKSDINVILKNYRIPFIKEVIPTYKVKLL
jgi:hypothetical protein